jgi:hypothetical protein
MTQGNAQELRSEENMNLNKYIQAHYQQEYDKGFKAAQEKEAETKISIGSKCILQMIKMQ